MADEPEVIRQEIEETRSSIAEKLETLETEVRDTVQTAKATVEETIGAVKETVAETVDTVQRTFDLEYQVCKRPWTVIGLSVAAGFAAGWLLPGRRSLAEMGGSRGEPRLRNGPPAYPATSAGMGGLSPPLAQPEKPSVMSRVLSQFDDEIEKVQQLAVGAIGGVVRDWLQRSLPQSLGHQVREVMDSTTSKLGGKPVQGPVLEPSQHRCPT